MADAAGGRAAVRRAAHRSPTRSARATAAAWRIGEALAALPPLGRRGQPAVSPPRADRQRALRRTGRGAVSVSAVALSLAISPCPNDTFVFHALVHGLVPGAPPVDVTYADVDVTNTAAERGEFDLVKVSYAALPWLLDEYELLPCGGALGRGCGPLVLTRDAGDRGRPGPARRVAVPGDRTTAYLLFRLWSADAAAGADRGRAVPRDHAGRRRRPVRRRPGHPRGPLHLPAATA